MAGMPREVQQWAVVTTRGELVRFLNDLSVPESILQPYIVKKTEAVLPPVTKTSQNNTSAGNKDEPMELDSPATSTSSSENASINLSEVEGDPLPPVVIGTESWHNQVPAVGVAGMSVWVCVLMLLFFCRIGFLLLQGTRRDKGVKIHSSRSVMHICLVCPVRGGRLLQVPSPREVCLKLLQVNTEIILKRKQILHHIYC